MNQQGIEKLNEQIDLLAADIAEDIKNFRKGKIDDLKILSADDTLFQRLMAIVKNKGDWKEPNKGGRPPKEVPEITNSAEENVIQKNVVPLNSFEAAQNRVKAKVNGGG